MRANAQTAKLMLDQYRNSLPKEVGELGRPEWIDYKYTFIDAHINGEQVTFQFSCKPVQYGSRLLVGILLPALGKDDIGPARKLFDDSYLTAELSRCDIRPLIRECKERGRSVKYV